MDTFTHAVSGALAARAAGPVRGNLPSGVPPARVRGWVGFWAAVFPDIDYPLRHIDMLLYLRIHRAETHSLLLLPVWAVLIGALFYGFYRGRYSFRWLVGLAGLGIFIHILGDVITDWGTQVLAPLSDWAPALGWVFVVDVWLTLILVVGLLLGIWWSDIRFDRVTLMIAVGYILTQGGLHATTQSHAAEYAASLSIPDAEVAVFAQPLSPFNRLILITDPATGTVERARINLLRTEAAEVHPTQPWPLRMHHGYGPISNPTWSSHEGRPAAGAERALVRAAWENDLFAPWRDTLRYPVLYRIDRTPAGACVWFTDLLYWYEPLSPSFRYGVCRSVAVDCLYAKYAAGLDTRVCADVAAGRAC